jgi:succinate-semialdehyde dehydrogenase/glutarate-semialdehyde dehydrogenase
MGIATINPATGQVIHRFEPLTEAQVNQALDLAQQSFLFYRQTSWQQRSEWMLKAAAHLEAESQAYGELITLEMGKPVKSAVAEVQKCAWVCRYYAEHAATFLEDEVIATDASRSLIRYQPLGVILGIMPWNFPFWQVFRFAAPALMAGNVALLKHASNVPQSALAIADVFKQAGFPLGVFQSLLISSDQVAAVLTDERVKGVALTGSEAAGSQVAALAGQHLKKSVLELGGSDPFIVLESADLEAAVATAVTARMISNGQSCIAAKRFILQERIAESFLNALVKKYQALNVGDPLLPETDLGPLATAAILQEVDWQVKTSVEQGAQVLLGGQPLEGPGHFYPPTILTQIPPQSPAAREEVFGPVALIFTVPNLAAAIQLANATPFGLGASGWTQDPDEQERLMHEIEAGSVFINGMVKSDPRLPFGGIKRSGYGRELGEFGIQEFVNIKTIWIK